MGHVEENDVINIKEFIEGNKNKAKPQPKPKKNKSLLGWKHKFIAFVVLILIAMAVVGAVKLIDWGATHQLQRPWYFEIREDSLFNKFRTRLFYKEIEPKILVPTVREESFSNLSPIEQKILDAFGQGNYRVMRAIATCESRKWEDGKLIPYDPLAVNWATKDVGLFQIHWERAGSEDFAGWGQAIEEEFGYTLADMFDVDKNIEVARWIWDRDGDGVGNINPWVATTTECFREEL